MRVAHPLRALAANSEPASDASPRRALYFLTKSYPAVRRPFGRDVGESLRVRLAIGQRSFQDLHDRQLATRQSKADEQRKDLSGMNAPCSAARRYQPIAAPMYAGAPLPCLDIRQSEFTFGSPCCAALPYHIRALSEFFATPRCARGLRVRVAGLGRAPNRTKSGQALPARQAH